MGQICTKPTESIHQVYPDPSSSPLGSRQRIVSAYTSPTVCTRIDITRYKLPSSAENLVCDFSGGAGCFVCDIKNIKALILDEETRIFAYDKTPLNPAKVYEFIQSPDNNACVKIFYDSMDKAYNTEVGSYTIIKKLVGDNAPYLTTYAEYREIATTHAHVAFRIQFHTKRYDVYINGKPVKSLQCIFFNKCNQSLDVWRDNPTSYQANLVKVMEMFYSIGCMLQLLHGSGYAHLDIKPENIVYCENEPIKYKLIDLVLKHMEELKTPIYFTPKFLLPTLYQELIFKRESPSKRSWNDRKIIARRKMIETYYPLRDKSQAFLIQMSLDAFDEDDIKAMRASGDYSILYYKSDEYALAMVILELLDIREETDFNKASKDIQEVIRLLLANKPYFRRTNIDECRVMAEKIMGRTRSAHTARSTRLQ